MATVSTGSKFSCLQNARILQAIYNVIDLLSNLTLTCGNTMQGLVTWNDNARVDVPLGNNDIRATLKQTFPGVGHSNLPA